MHICIGAASAFTCHRLTQNRRDSFLQVKRIKQAASQSRRFLSTLIPPNVLARMATHDRSCSITTCLCDVMLL